MDVPSGKLTVCYGKSSCLMAMFNSYVKLPGSPVDVNPFCHVYKTPTQKRDLGKKLFVERHFRGSSQPPAMRMMKLQPDSHGGPDS